VTSHRTVFSLAQRDRPKTHCLRCEADGRFCASKSLRVSLSDSVSPDVAFLCPVCVWPSVNRLLSTSYRALCREGLLDFVLRGGRILGCLQKKVRRREEGRSRNTTRWIRGVRPVIFWFWTMGGARNRGAKFCVSLLAETNKRTVDSAGASWYNTGQSTFAGLGISRFFLSLRFSALLPLSSRRADDGENRHCNQGSHWAERCEARNDEFATRPQSSMVWGLHTEPATACYTAPD
jgi:hypothetical protein